MNYKSLMFLIAFLCSMAVVNAQNLTLSRADLIAITPEWDGERFPDGRPKVSDAILERMKKISLEQVWSVLRGAGYPNQYADDWKNIHPGETLVGRVLTAQYMPSRKDVRELLVEKGETDGRIGDMVSWPIDLLSTGDVYVADSYGKVDNGPIIGDNLATSIAAKSGNGVVINGTVRDLEGLRAIPGFTSFIKGSHPSYQTEMMLTGINTPIRISSVTVLPGDIVLGKLDGVIFIPPHLAEKVVKTGELVLLRDQFGHLRLREGNYTPGQIDGRWTDEIEKDFSNWLEKNMSDLPVSKEEIEELLKSRTW